MICRCLDNGLLPAQRKYPSDVNLVVCYPVQKSFIESLVISVLNINVNWLERFE